MNAHVRVILCSLLGSLLFGCISVPREAPRDQTVTASSLGLGASVQAPAEQAWWSVYGDSQLNRLMQQALSENPTLAQAIARVRQAQATADLARAGFAPSVTYDATETRKRFSSTDAIPPQFRGGMFWQGHQGLELTWDADFWGRQHALLHQANSERLVTELDAAGARLALEAAVLRAYVELDRNYALADIAERTTSQRSQILDITRRRVRSGLDTNVELREAEGAVPQARVELQQAQLDRDWAIHLLAALTGRGAGEYANIERPHWRMEAAVRMPESLPANLLGRRPDVLAARSRVEATSAGRAAVKAGFYPDVNLSAFAGTSAIGLTNLFHARSSGVYGAGPAIYLPVFDAGRLKAQYRGATAEIDAAIDGYNETVVRAVREVSDQLTSVNAIANQLDEQRRSLDSAEAAYRLASERYEVGLSNYLTVLSAESEVLSARRQRVQLMSAQVIARVSLLVAIGGSFDPSAPLPAAAAQN